MISTIEDLLAIERMKKLRIQHAHYFDSRNIGGIFEFIFGAAENINLSLKTIL